MRLRLLVRLLAVLGALAAFMVVTVSGADADTVRLPTGASMVVVKASACPAAGDCVAVGSYEGSPGDYYGLIETESGGSWTVNTASLAGLEPDTSPNEGLRSVSCTSVGNCVAVGYYADSSGNVQGLIETESDGSWTASEASLAGLSAYGNPGVQLNSVSCPSAGNCVAIGTYYDGSNTQQGLIETESDGTWTASEATLPSVTGVDLDSVSCPSAGNCVAVGTYTPGGTQEGLIVSESGGSWTASEAALPSGVTSDYLESVSCASAGDCVAVGTAYGAGGLIDTDSGGSWSASAADLSSLDAAADSSQLQSVACVSVGNCAAVGDYDDPSGDQQGLMLSESGGSWSASEADLTGLDAASVNTDEVNTAAVLDSVACWSAGDCVAAGTYNNTSIDTNELVTSESAGSWSTYDQQVAGGGYSDFGGAACAPGGYCTIDSISGNSSETDAAMLDAPDAVSTPTATLSGTQASVSWSAPADDGGLPVSGYTVTVDDQTDPARGGQTTTTAAGATTATFSGLTPGDSYTFTVTALSPLGIGLPATTAAVSVAGTAPTVVITSTASQTTWYSSVAGIPAIKVSATVDASGLKSLACSGDGIASQSFSSVAGGTLSLTGLDYDTGKITCVVTANDGLAKSVSFTLHLWPPLKITDISLSGRTVTWCGEHCRFPGIQVRFTLDRPTTVRLVLRARDHGRWKQVATALIKAHDGRNRYRLPGRWHNHLVPSGKYRVLVQIKQNGDWHTHKTLDVTVRHTHRDHH